MSISMLSFKNVLHSLSNSLKRPPTDTQEEEASVDLSSGDVPIAAISPPTNQILPSSDLLVPSALRPMEGSMSQSKVSSEMLMMDELPDYAAPEMGDADDDVDPEERLRAIRNQQRGIGANVTSFQFTKRRDEVSDSSLRPNPVNPQNFTPRTNPSGKPRPTKLPARVTRYFREVHEDPKTATQLERTMHKMLIAKPTYVAPRCTKAPPGFLDASHTPASVAVSPQTLDGTVSLAVSMSPVGTRVVSLPPSIANSPAATMRVVSLDGSPNVRRMGQSQSRGGVSIADGEEPDMNLQSMSLVRDQSFASTTTNRSPMTGKKSSRFTLAMATKLKRKVTRRKTMQDLHSQLEQAEQSGAYGGSEDDFVDLPDEAGGADQSEDAGTGPDGANDSHRSNDESCASPDGLTSPKKKKKHAVYARSLYSTQLPVFSESGELMVRDYPKKLPVDSILDKVLRLEPAQILARISPAVDAFLKSPECKQMLLSFFWHSVVVMQKAKLEAELLRAHKAFEHAFYEVNPRSSVHPTIEQAEQALRSAPLNNLGATLDLSAMDPYAFSGYFNGSGLSAHPSFIGDARGTNSESALQDDDVGERYVVDIRHEALRVALDDLIIAQGELEDAVGFEEAVFHSMALNFGAAFRSSGGGGGGNHKNHKSNSSAATAPSIASPTTTTTTGANNDPKELSAMMDVLSINSGNSKPSPPPPRSSRSHDLYPFERKEAIFSVFPTIAAHATFYVMVKVFPNDAHAHIFNKEFRRDLLRRFSYWCAGVTMQHISTRNWPTPIEEDAAETTNVLTSKENVVNGQFAVMKEFHRRAHHSSHVFQEWLNAVSDYDALIGPGVVGGGEGHHPQTGVTNNTSIILSHGKGSGSMFPAIAQAGSTNNASGRAKLVSDNNTHVVGVSMTVPASVAQHQRTQQPHQQQQITRGRSVAPTLQSAATLWYSFGAARGQLTSERKFEYGCAGVVAHGDHGEQIRVDNLKLAGAAFSSVPQPIAGVAGGLHSGTASQTAMIPPTSPFMRHYAQSALSVELKVVDLAGREAPALQFTQLSALDKYSVHLRFALHAQNSQANANSAVEENLVAQAQQNRLAHKLEQENEHFKRVEELKLHYANRLINFHLSPRNPECIKDALHCERLLRDALQAPSILTAQSTQLCQQALRSYQQIMFQPSDRRQVLHELSIRVACRIRQLQRLRGDVWGGNEHSMTSRSRSSSNLQKNRRGLLSPLVDVAHADFNSAVQTNEFPLIGDPLDAVAEKIVLHQHGQVVQHIRVEEESRFSDMMSEFMKTHKRIFLRDRSRYPLMRASFLPFAVKDDRGVADLSAEDRWRGQIIAGSETAMTATKLFARGQIATVDAANKLKGLASFDSAFSPESNLFLAAQRRDDQLHVEQLRQRLETETQDRHDALQNELDAFVSATAIGRRGRLLTPQNGNEGAGLKFGDAAGVLNDLIQSPRAKQQLSRPMLDNMPVPPALLQPRGGTPGQTHDNGSNTFSPVQTPMSPNAILQRLNVQTPQAPLGGTNRSGARSQMNLLGPRPPELGRSPGARATSSECVSPTARQFMSPSQSWSVVSPQPTNYRYGLPEILGGPASSQLMAEVSAGELSSSSRNVSVDNGAIAPMPEALHPRHKVPLIGASPRPPRHRNTAR
ncbi:Hypothetical protein, putative [Bodo saltans]|uniref:Uncharacterized protein n=1 Tax=Bodo saltans TaxID=75058 RepID=A0A0S4IVH7_BODSA|nr:Hypothetical protein, putative [Bodo saltans]|eukprot:CUG00602.1 Hypothetical protein, putative [Bodo saltans]